MDFKEKLGTTTSRLKRKMRVIRLSSSIGVLTGIGLAVLPPSSLGVGPQIGFAQTQDSNKGAADAAKTPVTKFTILVAGKPITVPAGTPVNLQIEQKIKGIKARVGDELSFTVREDVSVGDAVVFKKGASAKGVVSFAQDAKTWNKGSKLGVDVLWTTAVDGQQIPTLTRFEERPRNESLNRIMSFGLLSPFSKGKNTNIKKGAKYDAFVGEQMIMSSAPDAKQITADKKTKEVKNLKK